MMDRKNCDINIVFQDGHKEDVSCIDWWWEDTLFVIITSGDPSKGGGNRRYINRNNIADLIITEKEKK